LQKAKADQEAYQQSYEERLRSLNGRVEALEHQNQLLNQEEDQLNKKLQLQQDRFKELEQAILQLEQRLTAKATEESKPEKTASGKKKNYFDDAEEFYVQKEWKKAIASYQKYRDQSPDGKEFVQATLKIGICFQELGLSKEARVFFDEVIEKSPKSKWAKIAASRIKKK